MKTFRIGERVSLNSLVQTADGVITSAAPSAPYDPPGSTSVYVLWDGKTVPKRVLLKNLRPEAKIPGMITTRLAPSRAQRYAIHSGYAYEYKGKRWRTSSSEQWEHVVVSGSGAHKFVGIRGIDDSPHVVFQLPNGTYLAQLEHMARIR